jgi:hypothetical protein
MTTEIKIRFLKDHSNEFPESIRNSIIEEPENMDIEAFLADLRQWERELKKEVRS